MRIPLSPRLRCCADRVLPGSRVADIGCDHGYLGIWLVKQAIAQRVIACDLRPKPLERARENARRFQIEDRMEFRLGSGLEPVRAKEADTLVFAGMGGELTARLLDNCPWICQEGYRLILQPQASANDLRRWLGEHGFAISRETLVEDGGFLYSVMTASFGEGTPLTPGQQYISPAVLQEESPLLVRYLDRVCRGLSRAVRGLEQSKDQARLAYYRQALEEAERIRKDYGDDSGDFAVLTDAGAHGV